MSAGREHDFTPGRAARVGEHAAAGDTVYTGGLDIDNPRKAHRMRAAMEVLREVLAARALVLRPTGPFYYVVVSALRLPETCSVCSYRIAYGRCQRCGTAPAAEVSP